MINTKARKADLDDLRKVDSKRKGSRFDLESETLVKLYEDNARDHMVSRLQELGMGVPHNKRPLEVSLLRFVIDRLAVTYANPPARWLVGTSGKRLSETSDKHKLVMETLEQSQYDLAWRELDRRRALCRQAALRFYPVDELGRVEVRVFSPHHVLREPHPAVGHVMDHDRRFALALAGDVYEYWWRIAPGGDWLMVWTDKQGNMLDDDQQPFADSGYVSPYADLPVQLVFDSFPAGSPWMHPRGHRVASIEAITAITNDLLQIVRTQAHSQRVFTGVRAEDLPADRGPGVDIAIEPDEARALDLTPNPRIKEALETLQHDIRMFLLSEGLPIDMLDPGRQVQTGARLKQEMAGLSERRKSQAPMAVGDERSAFSRYRAVHNYHARAWGAAPMPGDVRLDVEIAPLDLPVDAQELVQVGSRNMALGTDSRITLIMAQRSCSRSQALKFADQVDADNVSHPPPIGLDKVVEQELGPKAATPATGKNTTPDIVLDQGGEDSRDSVLDAIRNAG